MANSDNKDSSGKRKDRQHSQPSVNPALGKELKRWRINRTLSQVALAKKANITPNTIWNWEHAQCWPRAPEINAVLKALDLQPEDADAILKIWSERGQNVIELPAMEIATLPSLREDPAQEQEQPPSQGAIDTTETPATSETPAAPKRDLADASEESSEDTTPPASASETPSAHAQPTLFELAARRMRRWRPIYNIATLVAVLVLLVLLTSPATLLPPQIISLATMRIPGWFVAVQWRGGEPRIVVAINTTTGAWRALWPPTSSLLISGPVANIDQFYWLKAPVINSYTHQLAFISWVAVGAKHVSSIWVGRIIRGPDGWPIIAHNASKKIIDDCDNCGALAWSPDGEWLLFDKHTGLFAYSMLSGKQIQITHTAGDHWPACSPNGQWLAYQNGKDPFDDLVAVPAKECLPDSHSRLKPRYLVGYTYSWRPAWSLDSARLAFVSNSGGQQIIYVTSLDDMTTQPTFDTRTSAQPISIAGCYDPAWAPAGNVAGEAIAYTCDAPVPTHHNGSLVVVPIVSVTAKPATQATISSGYDARVGLFWTPEWGI